MGSQPIEYFHSYYSGPPQTKWNTCGQAAVAAMLDFHGASMSTERSEYDTADERSHWPQHTAINEIKAHHPPDRVFGCFGTGPDQIVRALRYRGLWAQADRARTPVELRDLWTRVERSIDLSLPVITILNRSKLGARPFLAHWAIAYCIQDSKVLVANTDGVSELSEATYRWAMNGWWMPPSYRNCTIFTAPWGDDRLVI